MLIIKALVHVNFFYWILERYTLRDVQDVVQQAFTENQDNNEGNDSFDSG